MSTINQGSDPSDERHNTPPAEGAMDRFAELPRPTAHNPFQWVPPMPLVEPTPVVQDEEFRSTRLGDDSPFIDGGLTQLHRALGELRRSADDGHFTAETASYMRTVLDELERRDREAEQDVAHVASLSAPEPGLFYADPQGRFECKPAEAAWREAALNSLEMLSVLELRVMSAHITTALDNITKVLGRKSEESHR